MLGAPTAALPVRRGGVVALQDGRRGLWSVAQGRRGRRWRWAILADRSVDGSYLLETDPAGRFVRLEGSTAAGLLTAHPEVDGSRLHGNVVTPAGVRHLALPWSDGTFIDLAGDPLFPGIMVAAVGVGIPVGSERRVPVVTFDRFWRHRWGSLVVARLGEERWEVRPTEEDGLRSSWVGEVGANGIPRFPSGTSWELELPGV